MKNTEEVLTAFLSSDNNVRKESEAYINNLKQNNFNEGLEFFVSGLKLQKLEVMKYKIKIKKKKLIIF